MRRSPAEYYIRYRLILDRARADQAIEDELADDLVFLPNKKYLGELRNRLVFPPTFRPMDLSHTISQTFIRAQQVWSMFHPNRGTREAVAAFNELPARTMLQTLLSSPNPDAVTLDVFVKRTGMPMSEGGLAEFKHYFWNLRLITLQELAEYVRTFLGDKVILDVLRLPKSREGMTVGLARVGVMPKELDEAEAYETFSTNFYVDFLELKATLGPSLQRTTALKMAEEGCIVAVKERKALASHRGEVIDQIMAVKAATRDMLGTTLIDLKEGVPPVPVGLLPEDLDEEKEVADGGKRTSS